MFALPLKKQEGIILVSNEENLAAIHMLFVFFPIDVLWLDTKGVVISKAACVQPFTLAVTPPKKARYIVELEAGAAKRIWKNDVIIIKK